MTTISSLISDAFRESGIIGVADTLDSNMQTEGLRRINALIYSLIGSELGENLPTISYGSQNITNTYGELEDYSSFIDSTFIPQNSRIIFNASEANTLFLDPAPRDGARIAIIDNAGNFATYNQVLNGNGRSIETSATVTLSTSDLVREWFYRADLANWVKVTDLIVSDQSPFPAKFDDLLIFMLAMRLNPSYGAATATETIALLDRARAQFRSRYRQERQVRADEALASINPWGYNYGYFRL